LTVATLDNTTHMAVHS